ncbi:MAG TPA: ATP-binding cassette domain-containing protein [Bacteroidales bacterium]|nr:ATP-binding cassette domain-containing protein [Bacteroidales bacterium]HSA42350.1 ATP-binding cassette domain-containing protein [Bacteroidales bacterium]
MQTTDSNIILDIQNLSCGYGGKPVFEDFNLQVGKGDCIAITGPNGCGKSTLLKAIYQLCVINSGTISYNGHLLNGKNPEQVKKLGIAYFMQKNAIFAKLSVKENLLLSLNGTSKTDKKQKIEEIIAVFPDIGKWQNKTAGLLSGGQRQQLSMAMLLSQDANLWLLDEFSAGLDTEKSEDFLQLVLKHFGKTSDNPNTIIFVEHKNNIINKLGKRIINFNSL